MASNSAAEYQLRQANFDILQLRSELGIDETPDAEFEEFLEATNQLTPKAVRAAQAEFNATEEDLIQDDFQKFMHETGQMPVPKLNARAGEYSKDMLALRSVASQISGLKAQLGLDDTPQEVSRRTTRAPPPSPPPVELLPVSRRPSRLAPLAPSAHSAHELFSASLSLSPPPFLPVVFLLVGF
eukprot:SAG22_NODE_272_length_13192_cov_311.812495_7_plen_184_part_00